MAKIFIKDRFATTPNQLLYNKEISLKAKGLYGYIQAKPDNWEFSAERIALETKDGVQSIRAALKELEDFGYLQRVKSHTDLGHWQIDYILYSEPNTNPMDENPADENPTSGNPTSGNPTSENHTNNIKKDYIKKELKKKERKKDIFTPPTIEEVIYYFKEKGYNKDSAEKAFNYYDAANWVDSKGSKIKSWKQKMIGVWFKDENKLEKPKSKTKITMF